MASSAPKHLFKLYVGSIPWTVGHNELKQYFSKFGPVSLATVIFDKNTGLSRNYGFVHFANREGFEGALNASNHKLEGNQLKVQPSSGMTSN